MRQDQSNVQIQVKANVLYIKGILCFDTVLSFSTKAQQLFKKQSIQTIDLQEVSQCDTAGLALLLEWSNYSKKMGKYLRYINVSQSVFDFARIHDLTHLFCHDAT